MQVNLKKKEKKKKQTSDSNIAAYPDDKSFQGTGSPKAADHLLR